MLLSSPLLCALPGPAGAGALVSTDAALIYNVGAVLPESHKLVCVQYKCHVQSKVGNSTALPNGCCRHESTSSISQIIGTTPHRP